MDHLTEQEVEAIVERTVRKTLLTIGVDDRDPIEIQRDLQWLRDWRKSADQMRGYGFRAVIGIIVAGAAAALWIGIQNVLTGK